MTPHRKGQPRPLWGPAAPQEARAQGSSTSGTLLALVTKVGLWPGLSECPLPVGHPSFPALHSESSVSCEKLR